MELTLAGNTAGEHAPGRARWLRAMLVEGQRALRGESGGETRAGVSR